MKAGRDSWAVVLGVAVVSALALSALGCNQLFYFPSREPHDVNDVRLEPVQFASGDGTRLVGALLAARDNTAQLGTVVQFHGNAGNVTTHLRSVRWLTRSGYQAFVFDYRGYGESEGFPTPRGVHEDALAALDYAVERVPRRGPTPDLVLYGQSLGGAVLLRALAERPNLQRVRAVVIEASFHSYQEVAASVTWRTPLLFPFTAVAYGFVSDEYAPAPFVSKVSPTPMMFVHGLEDEVVDPAFSAALFGLARAPRAVLAVPSVGHQGPMAVCAERYREQFLSFIRQDTATGCPSAPNSDGFLCEGVSGAPRNATSLVP